MTFVKTLASDQWDGGDDRGETVVAPSLEQVRAAIAMLDGDRHTLVLVTGDDEFPQLSVGGGNEGRFVAVYGDANGDFWLLEGDAAARGTVTVVTGGQAGDFKAKFVVDRSVALRAALAFFGDGEPRSEGRWTIQD
ncbi:MAG: hypothetical protein JWQ20_1332 [Conexibacter sp.]|jgi:hypothetical protein|nr:hypothetical protein [Conexibacter sp.]